MVARYGPDLVCSPLNCGTPPSPPHAQVRTPDSRGTILHVALHGSLFDTTRDTWQVTAECTSYRCQAVITCQPGYRVPGAGQGGVGDSGSR